MNPEFMLAAIEEGRKGMTVDEAEKWLMPVLNYDI